MDFLDTSTCVCIHIHILWLIRTNSGTRSCGTNSLWKMKKMKGLLIMLHPKRHSDFTLGRCSNTRGFYSTIRLEISPSNQVKTSKSH